MSEHPHTCIPIDLDGSSLRFSAIGIPSRSRTSYIAVARFSGRIGGTYPIEHDIRFIRSRCHELLDLHWTDFMGWSRILNGGIIVDLSGIEPPAVIPDTILFDYRREWPTPCRVVAPSGIEITLSGVLEQTDITDSLTSAIEEIRSEHLAQNSSSEGEDEEIDDLADRSEVDLTNSLAEMTDLQAEYFQVDQPLNNVLVGVVRIKGKYHDGAVGKDDALAIGWFLSDFCDELHPSGLVIDLREFQYSYGDDLALFPTRGPGPIPLLRYIVSDDQLSELTLPISQEDLNSTIDEAIDQLLSEINDNP